MPQPSVWRQALADALALVLPVACAGCDEPDTSLCETCSEALAPVVQRQLIDGFPVWSGLVFEGASARVIRSLKEDGRTGLARDLAPALAAAAASVADAVFVPVPTSRASFRRRGFHVVELVARRARLPVVRALRHTRQPGDQRGLGIDQRRDNVAGSLVAQPPVPSRAVVIDDVVTTGSTLAEAVRALRAAGCDVVGAVTIAGTPRRRALRWTEDDTPGTGG